MPLLPKWSQFLENELTKAVLIAMDSGDIGNSDFTVATGTTNTDTNSRAKTRSSAQNLHVSTEADMRQGQPAVEVVPMTSSSRLNRPSWAGIMTSKGGGTISRKEGKEVEMRARRACSFSGVDGVREDAGATGATGEPARIHAGDGFASTFTGGGGWADCCCRVPLGGLPGLVGGPTAAERHQVLSWMHLW